MPAAAARLGTGRVVIGVPLYQGEAHVRAAFESLLAQRFADLRLVAVDDRSTDRTAAIAREIADRDARVRLFRNRRRLGLARNWQRAFGLAVSLYPDADYFAWGSDHDVWHPDWLGRLVRALDDHPDVVLAYPSVVRIGPDDAPIEWPDRSFESQSIADPARRVQATLEARLAGNMIYGLFRLAVLRRTVTFRNVMLPDRLLLGQLAMHGTFAHVDAPLWHRRVVESAGSGHPSSPFVRQRRALYPNRIAPTSYLPWGWLHGAILVTHLVVRGRGRPDFGRGTGLRLTAAYVQTARRQHKRRLRSYTRRRAKRIRKRAVRLMRRQRARLRRVLSAVGRGRQAARRTRS